MLKRLLSWQSKFNKFLQMYLLAPSDIPHFSTKKESDLWSYGKWQTFEKKI